MIDKIYFLGYYIVKIKQGVPKTCKDIFCVYQSRELQKEIRERKKAQHLTKFTLGEQSGKDAGEFYNKSYGGNASKSLLDDKTVTERDKVSIINAGIRGT